MKILAISGSLRAGSYNTALARAAAELAPAGVEIEVYEGSALSPTTTQDLDQEGIETPSPSRSSGAASTRPTRSSWSRRSTTARPPES